MRLPLLKHRTTSGLVIPDIHLIEEDAGALRAVEQYGQAKKPDFVVYLGDVLNFDCISAHNNGKPRLVEGKRIKTEFESANAMFNRHRHIFGAACQMILIEGNHEYRVERFIDAFPVFEGQLEVEKNIEAIANKTMRYVRFWKTGERVDIGKASFIHGRYTNKYHAHTHVDRYNRNVFYGHVHDVQIYSKISLGDDEIRVGQSLGCLCRLTQNYLHGAPTNWQHAFAEFHFQPNGMFNYYVPLIFNGSFVGPDGKIYRG